MILKLVDYLDQDLRIRLRVTTLMMTCQEWRACQCSQRELPYLMFSRAETFATERVVARLSTSSAPIARFSAQSLDTHMLPAQSQEQSMARAKHHQRRSTLRLSAQAARERLSQMA
jgi:hypothetical protein